MAETITLTKREARLIAQIITDVGYYEELHGVSVTYTEMSALFEKVMS